MSNLSRRRLGPALTALALDGLAVLVFVVVGRDEHEQGTAVGEIATVAAPFLSGLAVGTAIVWAGRREPRSLPAGLVVAATTLVVGTLLRRVVWDRGTAVAFVVVTATFLAVCLLGWRLIWRRAGDQPTHGDGPTSPALRRGATETGANDGPLRPGPLR